MYTNVALSKDGSYDIVIGNGGPTGGLGVVIIRNAR